MVGTVIVLDTHALLWWALEPDKLSKKARAACEQIGQDGSAVSAISFWELEVKVRRGKLELPLAVEDLEARARQAGLEVVPVTTAIALRAGRYRFEHRDPADRMILATAEERRASVLTKDELLHRAAPRRCIW